MPAQTVDATLSSDPRGQQRHLYDPHHSPQSDRKPRKRRGELEVAYARTLPTRAQKSMRVSELSIYSPTIEETWKDSGIRRLKLDGAISGDWSRSGSRRLSIRSRSTQRNNLLFSIALVKIPVAPGRKGRNRRVLDIAGRRTVNCAISLVILSAVDSNRSPPSA